MGIDDKQIKEANYQLELRLGSDRDEWRVKIQDLVSRLKNMNELAECQVRMLSYRQILLDKVTDFKTTIYKRNATWDKYYKELYRKYSIDYDVKLTNGEKHQFIKADLSALKIQLDMLQSHIDYYYECIKTLDNMAFAIRNRISLDDKEF